MAIQEIKDLVAKGKLETALGKFSHLCRGSDIEYIIIQIQSHFSYYNDEKRKGLLSTSDDFLQRNKISQSFLDTIKDYEESNTVINESPQLAKALINHKEKEVELYKTLLPANKDTNLNSLREFFSSNPIIGKDFSAIDEIFQRLNKTSSATTIDKKEVERITQSVKESTERIAEKLRDYQKEIVSAAIEFSINATRRKKQEIGFVYQTQGSGLILTLLSYVDEVLKNEQFKNHRILILVNRLNSLNTLCHAFSEHHIEDYLAPKSTQHLMMNLEVQRYERVIFSTIQKITSIRKSIGFTNKFLVVGYQFNVDRLNLFGLFPNAQFIHFSGVPLREKSSELNIKYIATYDFYSAINDGHIIPFSVQNRRVLREMNDSIYYDLDLERTENYFKSDSFYQTIAKDIIEHFKTSRDIFNGKAIVTVSNIESAELLCYLINQIEFEEIAVVIASNKDRNNNNELINEFSKKDSNFRIAIVVNMLLTGYSNPLLDTLYIVKRLSGHSLWQAIARINRIHPKKKKALIVDYFENLIGFDFDGGY